MTNKELVGIKRMIEKYYKKYGYDSTMLMHRKNSPSYQKAVSEDIIRLEVLQDFIKSIRAPITKECVNSEIYGRMQAEDELIAAGVIAEYSCDYSITLV